MMNKYWKDGIMGVVIGDALGCPVQFESRKEVARHPVTGMRGYGTFNLPAGSWTDDSSLTLALLDSIRQQGSVDYRDIMDNFVMWLKDGAFTPYGYSYDIGGRTDQSIRHYMRHRDPFKCGGSSEYDNGNGSLMRILPACLYCIEKDLPDKEAIDIIHKVGGDYLTDGDDLQYYGRLRDLGTFAALPESRIKSSGYVVDTLEAAVWCLLTTDSFEKALLKAVNLGEDTDTVGAVAGGLAGLYYGYEAIPEGWLSEIKKRDWIEKLCS